MASPAGTELTVADLDQFPDDGYKRELLGGQLFVSPPPAWRHQYVALRIARRLLEYAEQHGGQVATEPGLRVGDADYVEPDVVVVTAAAIPGVGQRFVEAAPALVVEVSSPSTRIYDLQRKRGFYERQEVPEFWFADVELDRIEVYRLQADGRYGPPAVVGRGETIQPPHLAGLVVDVEDVLGPPETA
jgi:Uma2 family endonuclease